MNAAKMTAPQTKFFASEPDSVIDIGFGLGRLWFITAP